MSTAPTREKAHILLVDDDEAIGRLFKDYMADCAPQWECNFLSDSTKVLSWLDLYPCDCLVLDLHMPGIDGLSLISLVREKQPKLPIIIFTGHGYDEAKMQQTLQAGANGYISKTLPPEEIYLAIRGAIKH
jgi:DNA-binding response OmpR family regulator